MQTMTIPDDSGFLGLVDYNSYTSFLSEEWDLPMMRHHLEEQIESKHLLFWSTGEENIWKVTITDAPSEKASFREFKSSILVTGGKLHLCNYETLTMGAQFADVSLPERHLKDVFIALDNGLYSVTCRQLFRPDELDYESEAEHFEIILQRTT